MVSRRKLRSRPFENSGFRLEMPMAMIPALSLARKKEGNQENLDGRTVWIRNGPVEET
jgi:hypothetical protein